MNARQPWAKAGRDEEDKHLNAEKQEERFMHRDRDGERQFRRETNNERGRQREKRKTHNTEIKRERRQRKKERNKERKTHRAEHATYLPLYLYGAGRLRGGGYNDGTTTRRQGPQRRLHLQREASRVRSLLVVVVRIYRQYPKPVRAACKQKMSRFSAEILPTQREVPQLATKAKSFGVCCSAIHG